MIRYELKIGLVIWEPNSPTPDTLEGYGHRNFLLVHADPAEREMLAQHGVKLQELVLKHHEIHQRVLPAEAKERWKKWRKERAIRREVEREVRARLRQAEARAGNGAALNGAPAA